MIKITLVGDLMFSRKVRGALDFLGSESFFSQVSKSVPVEDLVVGNLETAISDVGEPLKGKPSHVTFCAPSAVAKGLKDIGFNLLSLSNNHLGDYGGEAVEETLNNLDKNSIHYFGVTSGEGQDPYIFVKNGQKLGFLSYCTSLGPNIHYGKNECIGPERFKRYGKLSSFRQIAELKKKVDFLFVFMHWGHEHVHFPPRDVILQGHQLVDAGADCIVGTHPHFVQGIDIYKGKTIFYSLGNFVFSEPYKGSRWSMAIKFLVDDQLNQSFEVVPISIDDDGIPAVADSTQSVAIRDEVYRLSNSLSDENNPEVIYVTKEKLKWAIRNIYHSRSFHSINMFPWGIGLSLWFKVALLALKDYLNKVRPLL